MIRRISFNAANKTISRQALVKAFDNWRVNMNQENGSAPTSASSSRQTGQTRLQSVENFMKEQDAANALKVAEIANFTADPTKKQRKAILQAERDRLEAEQTANKASLEAEKNSIEQQANEAIKELGVINWVGKLLEYRNAHPTSAAGLTYAEEVVSLAPARYTCTVLIQESSQHFGKTISFSKKKDAKHYASKKAIDWLIGNDLMPADGSVKFPKALPPPVLKALGRIQQVTPSPAGTPKATAPTSFAGQVPELCMRLGFNPPSYEIKKDSENVAFWSGYAHFGGDPRIEGKIGEVKSVFGKSNTKEQIAMEVLSFLKDIERQRVEKDNKVEKDAKKRKRDSVSSGINETSGKLLEFED